MGKNYVFTSESVTEGHPDKIADQVSDSVLDAILSQDPNARVACETMTTTGLVALAGEITSTAVVDYQKVVRQKLLNIGYDDSSKGFCGKTCSILVALGQQSPDISMGVTEGQGIDQGQGAGDQGLMFGYAINEATNLMPYTIDFSHKLAKRLTDIRKIGIAPLLRPDGKTQVSAIYENGKFKSIKAIVVSTQHDESLSHKWIEEMIHEEVIKKVIPQEYLTKQTEYFINPTGRFVIGGPMGDCGLTGRKIIVDTYGGHGAHGGGAFSGKDPSKVDRSAAYAGRWVAKHIVASGCADKALVQLAYAIGVSKPVSIMIETFGSNKVQEEKITRCVENCFDLTPKGIIRSLELKRPIYEPLAAYGHFGREELGVQWEQLPFLENFKALL
jgi:S-adenosylmethionine synthetase